MSLDLKQLRKFARVRLKLRFTFTWEEVDEGDSSVGYFALYETVDVSAGGVAVARLDSSSPVPRIGQEGESALNVENQEVRCKARVVRRTDQGFAVQFLFIPLATEDRLVAYVMRQQALQRASRIPT